MEPEAFARLHPQAYYSKFVSQGCRPDGRSLQASRRWVISPEALSSPYISSAIVRCGLTTALVAVTPMVAATGSAVEGVASEVPDIAVNVSFSPVASPRFRNVVASTVGAMSSAPQLARLRGDEYREDPAALAFMLRDTLQRSSLLSCLDLSPTRYVERQAAPVADETDVLAAPSTPPSLGKVTLLVDVLITTYDGNAVDPAMLAVCIAAARAQLPQYTCEWGSTKLVERAATPFLSLLKAGLTHIPLLFPSTFVTVPLVGTEESESPSHVLICDPCCSEEDLSQLRTTVLVEVQVPLVDGAAPLASHLVTSLDTSPYLISHWGGGSLGRADAVTCVAVAKARAAELAPAIQAALK